MTRPLWLYVDAHGTPTVIAQDAAPPIAGQAAVLVHCTRDAATAEYWRSELAAGRVPELPPERDNFPSSARNLNSQ